MTSINICKQCNIAANPIYANFRADVSCSVLDKLKAKGLTEKKLAKYQKCFPLIYPWDIDYDIYRQDVNRRFNVFPYMIMMACSEEDVLFAFKLVKRYKIPLALRSGSHNFEGYSLVEGIILDQSRRKHVSIDTCTKTFTAEAGVLLGPLALELFKYHLVEPSGTCANNGLFGLTLGGGIGFLSRKYGLTCDSLLEFKMILANGESVTVNHQKQPDLFWACKGGGGGNFGIVTHMKLNTYYINKVVYYRLAVSLSKNKLDILLPQWMNDSLTYPKRLSSEFDIINKEIIIRGLYLFKNEQDAEQMVKQILQPIINNVDRIDIRIIPYSEAARIFTGISRWLVFFKAKNSFIDRPFNQSAIDIIYKYTSEPRGTFLFTRLGGKISEIKPQDTAFPYRDSLYWLLLNAQWDNENYAADYFAWIENFYRELGPSLPGKVYVNAPDANIPNYLAQYYGNNLARLIEVKKKYDPENIFNYPQSIPVN